MYHLRRNPEDERALIVAHLDMVLGLPSHPLGKKVRTFGQSWFEPYARISEPTDDTLRQIVQTVKENISQLVADCLDYYKVLRASPHRIAYTSEAVQLHIMSLVYSDLFELCKKRHEAEELVYDQKVTELLSIHPAHLGITRPFWLLGQENDDDGSPPTQQAFNTSVHIIPNYTEHVTATPPYWRAIRTFRALSHFKVANQKLQCLVETARAICQCVEEYWKSRRVSLSQVPAIGGDELLPLFAYIVIKARVPHIYAECRFMELFIDEQQMMQQQGYLLATLQTALSLICCLDITSMENRVQQLISKHNSQKPSNAETHTNKPDNNNNNNTNNKNNNNNNQDPINFVSVPPLRKLFQP